MAKYISEERLKKILEGKRESLPGLADLIRELADGYEDIDRDDNRIKDLEAKLATRDADVEAARKAGYDEGFLDRYFKPGTAEAIAASETAEDIAEVVDAAEEKSLRELLNDAMGE